MNTEQLLQSKGISVDTPVLFISAQDALDNIVKYLERENLKLDLGALTSKEILTLISSYGECVVNYHPESYHQERATLLHNFDVLKKCGLQADDYEIIDFS